MREGWEIKKLGEICDVSAGQGAPQGNDKYSPTGTPFVKAGDLSGLLQGQTEKDILQVSADIIKSHRLKVYPAGALLFAKSGMSCMKGYVYTLKHPCCVVSHLAILTPKGSSSSYLQYCLRHIKPNTLVKDPAYPSISLADISSMCIPVPPIQEQEKIVAELDCLSGIIEKKKQQLKELDNLAQSIFYDMFGEEQAIKHNWKQCRVGDVYKFQYGKGNKIPEDKGEYPCYGSNGMVGHHITFNSEDAPIIGHIGAYAGIVNWGAGKHYVTYNGVICKLRDNHNNSKYGFYLLKAQDYLNAAKRGGAQPFVSYDLLEEPLLYLPPLDLQNEFAKKIEAIEKQKELVKRSIVETETLFNSRMDYWFN